MNMLPIYIPKRVAEKVLFVGESIQMFEQDRSLNDLPELRNILEDKEGNFTKLLKNLAEEEEFSLRKFEGFVNEVRTYVAEVRISFLSFFKNLMRNFHLAFMEIDRSKVQFDRSTEEDKRILFIWKR